MTYKKDVLHRLLRPDLVVIDDLENNESILSCTQKDKLEKWFNDTIKKPKFGDLIRVYSIDGYGAWRYFSHFENGICYCFNHGEPIEKGSRTIGWRFWEHIKEVEDDNKKAKRMEFKILRIKGNTSNVVKTNNRLLAFKTFVWWIMTSDITEMSVRREDGKQ